MRLQLKLACLILSVTLCLCLPCSQSRHPHKPNIVGGSVAKPGDNPHMCSLQYNGKHMCGSAIISGEWLLTAAHCIKGLDVTKLTVRCGTLLHASPGKDYTISQAIQHENFDQYGDNDIALLKITGQFELGTQDINKINLPEQGSDVPAETLVTLTGWGYLNFTGKDLSPTLQTVDVPVVDRPKCVNEYKDYNPVTENMICAGLDAGGKDACQYDSGGPVKVSNVLVGIISWGNECAKPLYPGVYTRVGNYRDWIKTNTGV